MVQLKLGDKIAVCASISNFCSDSNFYIIKDINVSAVSCIIHHGEDYGCLPLNGVNLEFQWSNASGSSQKKTCTSDNILKVLGTATTNAQGVASLQYTITQEDLNIYNTNNELFDLRVCIRNSNISSFLFSEVRRTFQADGISIIENICIGVTCPDKCYNTDLWGMKCDPMTGECIQDAMREPNSLICSSTHYIEYDFTFLPSDFLNLIESNIITLSNWLGTHLPIPGNIQWNGASYSGGKFRIYVMYNPPSPSAIMREAGVGQIKSLGFDELLLPTFAGVVAGIIVFAITQCLLSLAFSPVVSIIAGAVFGTIATVAISYTIHEFFSGTSTQGIAPQQKPEDKLKIIEDYIDNYITPSCDQAYPGCAATPPTCDSNTMRAYLACKQVVSKCKYIAAIKGDPVTECDQISQKFVDRDTGLEGGTLTPADAKSDAEADENTVNNYFEETILKVTCVTDQTYDPTTQECIDITEECWISSPIGTDCLLTAKTGKTAATIGAVLVGGYILFNLIKK